MENLLCQRELLKDRYTRKEVVSDRNHTYTITDRDTEFLNRVREIIEENLANTDFRIEDLYKTIGMSRSKFFEKLKGLTGLSPIDFVKEYRLNHAIGLLRDSDCNVSEASYMSGFTDAGYFSKCFKEKFGISPSQVEKKIILQAYFY